MAGPKRPQFANNYAGQVPTGFRKQPSGYVPPTNGCTQMPPDFSPCQSEGHPGLDGHESMASQVHRDAQHARSLAAMCAASDRHYRESQSPFDSPCAVQDTKPAPQVDVALVSLESHVNDLRQAIEQLEQKLWNVLESVPPSAVGAGCANAIDVSVPMAVRINESRDRIRVGARIVESIIARLQL